MGIPGKLEFCARCGESTFLKRIHIQESAIGMGPINEKIRETYESVHDGWTYSDMIGYLCPNCSFSFKSKLYDFFCQCDDKIQPLYKFTPEELERYNKERNDE